MNDSYPTTNDLKEIKKQKKQFKKASKKKAAANKTYMEISRTLCSLGALTLSALSLLHSYHII